MTKTIFNIGISGAGRTAGLACYLSQNPRIKIRGGYDPDSQRMAERLEHVNNPEAIVYPSYEAMLQDPEIDWVMIGSPNNCHCDQILAAFRAEKNVFSEKPLAITIEECCRIAQAHAASARQLAMGFCLRYAELYCRAKAILDSGKLGRVISIAASENINPGHGAYIMSQWRRNRAIAGPHLLEKCSHDLDILNWLTGSLPRRVAAFGGTDFFVPENRGLLDIPEQLSDKKSFNSLYRLEHAWDKGVDPFTSNKDIEDNVVAIMEYYNGTRAQFQATMSNTLPERRMYINCQEGNMILDQYAASLCFRSLSDPAPIKVKLDDFHDAHLEGYQKVHSDADQAIMAELAETILTGAPTQCSSREGMTGSVTALMIDQSRISGNVIDLTATWEQLGIRH